MLQLSSNGEWVTDCLQLLGMEHETDLQRVQKELTTILQRQPQRTHFAINPIALLLA